MKNSAFSHRTGFALYAGYSLWSAFLGVVGLFVYKIRADILGFILMSTCMLLGWIVFSERLRRRYMWLGWTRIEPLFVLAFLFSLVISIIGYLYHLPYGVIYPDEIRFREVGQYVSETLLSGRLPSAFQIIELEGSYHIGNGILHGLLFTIFPGHLSPNALNSFLLIMIGLFVYKYVALTEKRADIAKLATILTLASPSMLHWSSVGLKEICIGVLLLWVLYLYEKGCVIHKFSPVVVILLFLLVLYRSYFAIILSLLFAILFIFSKRIPIKVKTIYVITIVVFAVAFYVLMRDSFVGYFDYLFYSDKIEAAKQFSSDYLEKQGLFLTKYSEHNFVSYLIRFVTCLTTPNPFNIFENNKPGWYIDLLPWYLGNMLWLFLLPFAFMGCWRSIRRRKHMLAFFFTGSILLVYTSIPFLIDSRHRAPLMPILFIFSSIGFCTVGPDVKRICIACSVLIYGAIAYVSLVGLT